MFGQKKIGNQLGILIQYIYELNLQFIWVGNFFLLCPIESFNPNFQQPVNMHFDPDYGPKFNLKIVACVSIA